jgi:hypothetical protein
LEQGSSQALPVQPEVGLQNTQLSSPPAQDALSEHLMPQALALQFLFGSHNLQSSSPPPAQLEFSQHTPPQATFVGGSLPQIISLLSKPNTEDVDNKFTTTTPPTNAPNEDNSLRNFAFVRLISLTFIFVFFLFHYLKKTRRFLKELRQPVSEENKIDNSFNLSSVKRL